MTRPAPGISSGAQSFNWLVNRFADGTAGVIAAIAVSADRLLIAMSAVMERDSCYADGTGWAGAGTASL